MTSYENMMIKEQVYYEMYKNERGGVLLKLLEEVNRKIASEIKKSKYITSKERYKELSQVVKKYSSELVKGVVSDINVEELIQYELEKHGELLNQHTGYEVVIPSIAQVKSAIEFRPFANTYTWQSYLDGIEDGLYNLWDSSLRTGYLAGMSTSEIVRTVIGGMDNVSKLKLEGLYKSFKNNLYYNTLTMLQMIANESREKLFRENEEYFGDDQYKYEGLATLDRRTCFVCARLDKKLYKTYEECPKYPIHRSCRCLIIPYVISLGKRSSEFGEYADVSYKEWFSEQSDKVQEEILGESRYMLYKNGMYNVDEFATNTRVKTLEELRGKV